METDKQWFKPFLRLYLGQAFSLLSSSAVQYAIIWWITVETGSAISLTLASLIGLMPQILLGTFAGVLIDRHKRKSIMILADTAVALSSLVLAFAFFFGDPPMWLIYTILFARALGETFHKPALQAAIPLMVPPQDLTRAGGLGQLITSLTTMVGPFIGALLISVLTLQVILVVDILGAFVAVFILSTLAIPRDGSQTTKNSPFFQDMKAGFSAFTSNKGLVRATIPIFFTSMVFMPLGSLLPLMVREYFKADALVGGLIQTVFSLGMLISAMVFGLLGQAKRPFRLIAFSSLLLGLASLVAGLLPPSALWALFIVVFIIGTTGMMGNIPYMAYIQRSTDPQNLGKVIALVTSLISMGIPLGLILAGPIAEFLGVGTWLLGVGFLLVLIGVMSYLSTRAYDQG